MNDIVAVRTVSKMFGAFRALDNISLNIEEGEFVALLGPSGCGKTTLLRCIAGFLDPDAGSIEIAGANMNGIPPYHRPVNTVFQSYALFPHMDIAANIAYGPRRKGKKRAEVEETVRKMLELVGLSDFADRYPSQLSGGQQQRAALARAVAGAPKVLLLDEPLAALDLQLRKKMQLELKHMQNMLNITFVIVTHDQEEALVMADRIAVMNSGRIMQVGSGEDIYHRPANRFVASFIGEINLLDCQINSDGTVTLKREGVTFSPQGLSDKSPREAAISVRPEDVLVSGQCDSANSLVLPATVREAVFTGNSLRLYAETSGGNVVQASVSSRLDPSTVAPGNSVNISWPVNQCSLVEN
jgi:spermidine/putrescine transport system ATP-binding protein